MSEFKVGDRVRRVVGHSKINIGAVGTVMKVAIDHVRVRYDDRFPSTHDGCYKQLAVNISHLREDPWNRPKEERHAGLGESDLYTDLHERMRKLEIERVMMEPPRPLSIITHGNPVSNESGRMWRDIVAEPPRVVDPCPPLPPAHPQKPPLGHPIGMFIRDGMPLKQARAAIAMGLPQPEICDVVRGVRKISATMPAPKSITVHKAPRSWGWLNVKLGIGSSKHVMWDVAPVLDAFGRET